VDGKGHVATAAPSQADRIRTIAARVVWGIFLVFGLILASAALLKALEANESNSLVKFIFNFADAIDLGVFDLDNPIREFSGENSTTKEALLSYGLGAVAYLIVGRILERLIQPVDSRP
jgi:hypothetical protein